MCWTTTLRAYLRSTSPASAPFSKDREVNDPGGTLFGNAFGDQGQARLDWAFARLKEKVQDAEKRAENPTNKVCWIKVAAFGFSRGAALARAFCRDLQKLCVESASSSTGWRLRQGRHPIEVTFLGLFDTVASAGLPPSANNTLKRNRYVQAVEWINPMGKVVRLALQTPELKQLAFGQPGADPAPGPSDGHATWAKGMQIGSMVTHCVHMIAAHETAIRLASTAPCTKQRQTISRFPQAPRKCFTRACTRTWAVATAPARAAAAARRAHN